MLPAKKNSAWPAAEIVHRKVSELLPYARNSRTHSPEQVGQVAASIQEFGWTVPVLIDEDNGIIAGHCRVMAAAKLKIAEIPCTVAAGWSESKKRAYVIADNKLTLNGGWDEEVLRNEFAALLEDGFDVGLTGFGQEEIEALLAECNKGQNEAATVSLSDRFIVPPFSVLDARQGYWQERKKQWLSLGIASELGRGGGTWRESQTGSPIDRKRNYDAR